MTKMYMVIDNTMDLPTRLMSKKQVKGMAYSIIKNRAMDKQEDLYDEFNDIVKGSTKLKLSYAKQLLHEYDYTVVKVVVEKEEK